MYNPGFGDSFLLAFPADGPRPFYLLIDCGVHHQYPAGDQRIRLVAQDILEATGGHIDIAAITHEHTDHLYGFKYARDIFDRLEIDRLWLAWTEDPSDPTARLLKQLFGLSLHALDAAAGRLRLAGNGRAEAIQGILGFEAMSATGGRSPELDYLRQKCRKSPEKPEDYRHPGEKSLTLPGVKDVKIYVLGPPADSNLIKILQKKSELYPQLTALDDLDSFAAALLPVADNGGETEQDSRRSHPFEKSFEIAARDAPEHPLYRDFFRSRYGFTESKDEGPAWRRIENDWLGTAEQLALKLNEMTNNTSLALAVELTGSQPHQVLLLAADAQVGNWLSWQKLQWPGEGGKSPWVTGEDLMRRTVLLKVGHHGSRNATLKQHGLEMMDSRDLVAMLPVDQKWANKDMHWEHPADKVLSRLMEKARGRVIRSDRIPDGNEYWPQPAESNREDWKALTDNLDWDRGPDRLWIQYSVKG